MALQTLLHLQLTRSVHSVLKFIIRPSDMTFLDTSTVVTTQKLSAHWLMDSLSGRHNNARSLSSSSHLPPRQSFPTLLSIDVAAACQSHVESTPTSFLLSGSLPAPSRGAGSMVGDVAESLWYQQLRSIFYCWDRYVTLHGFVLYSFTE